MSNPIYFHTLFQFVFHKICSLSYENFEFLRKSVGSFIFKRFHQFFDRESLLDTFPQHFAILLKYYPHCANRATTTERSEEYDSHFVSYRFSRCHTQSLKLFPMKSSWTYSRTTSMVWSCSLYLCRKQIDDCQSCVWTVNQFVLISPTVVKKIFMSA